MSRTSALKKSVALTAAGGAILALSACGSPLDDGSGGSDKSAEEAATDAIAVYEKFAAMDEPERTEALIKAAQKEGSLTIYGTDSLGVDIGDEFTKKYGIKINFLDGEGDATVTKIIQEADGGKYNVDFTNGGEPLLEQLDSEGLLGDYESPLREQVPDDGKGEHWTGYRRQPFVAAYNTDEIDPSEIPTDYLDFADPKWKGKISVILNDYDWYMGLVMYYESQGMSREDIDAAFEKIVTNARIADGHSTVGPLLAAGQFAVTLSAYVHHVAQVANDGAPVEWGGDGDPVVQPIIMRYEGVTIMSHAPHPAAALLFMDYVLGPDGAGIVRDEDQLPAIPDPNGDPLDGLNVVLMDSDEFANNSAQWSNEWDELLRKTH